MTKPFKKIFSVSMALFLVSNILLALLTYYEYLEGSLLNISSVKGGQPAIINGEAMKMQLLGRRHDPIY